MTEWPNVPVLKTGVRVTGPRVQISPPPPYFNGLHSSAQVCMRLVVLFINWQSHFYALRPLPHEQTPRKTYQPSLI